jgi:hypothetical protein
MRVMHAKKGSCTNLRRPGDVVSSSLHELGDLVFKYNMCVASPSPLHLHYVLVLFSCYYDVFPSYSFLFHFKTS